MPSLMAVYNCSVSLQGRGNFFVCRQKATKCVRDRKMTRMNAVGVFAPWAVFFEVFPFLFL